LIEWLWLASAVMSFEWQVVLPSRW